MNWDAPFAYVAGSLHAILSEGTVYDIHSKAEKFDINSIPSGKPNLNKMPAEGARMIFRDGMVQLEKTTRSGEKLYFNLNGNRIK